MRARPRVLLLALVLALPALAPQAQAHENHPPGTEPDLPGAAPATDDTTPPSRGYTGPGRQGYINFYEGIWFYGSVSAAPIADQYPIHVRGDGDWLVWEDGKRADIYAYNIPAGVGQYLTSDRSLQRNPEISDDVVVWEDYRNSTHADVYAFFLQTGELRRLSSGPGNHMRPSIQGNLVAWEDDRDRNGDIWGYNLENKTQFPIFVGPDRESDPVVVGHQVYFRTYRFNVWDVMAVDLLDNSTLQATSDIAIQSAPFTNGTDAYFLTQFFTAWTLDRYDAELDERVSTNFKFQDTMPPAISGDHLLSAPRSGVYRQAVAINMTTGSSQHVTGSMPMTTEPFLDGRTAYFMVLVGKGVVLVTHEISPFAFSKPPQITVTTPRATTAWTQPVVVEGVLQADASWEAPATFTYRIGDGPPTALPDAGTFRFTLDPQGSQPGRHTLVIRATYTQGPPAEQTITLIIPTPGSTVNIEESARAFHAARVVQSLNTWFVQNPASYVVILIVLLVVALVLVRLWLMMKPRREKLLVEYVPPEEA